MTARIRQSVLWVTIVACALTACRATPPGAGPVTVPVTSAAPAPAATTVGASAHPAAGNVAILDIDDYDVAPAVALPVTATENCAVDDLTDDAANVVGSTGAGPGLPTGTSHGAAVFAQLQASLGRTSLAHDPHAVPLASDGAALPYVRQSDGWTYGGSRVVLLGVDTDAYTTHDVVDRLDQLVGSMRRAGFTRFVVNLSFIVVPCDIGPWLDAGKVGGATLLQTYQDLIAADPDLAGFAAALARLAGGPLSGSALTRTLLTENDLAEVTRRIRVSAFYGLFADVNVHDLVKASALPPTTPFGWPAAMSQISADPAWTRFVSGHGDIRFIAIGAAGNGVARHGASGLEGVRLGFPFAPAIWNDVVSVSAGTASGSDPEDATAPTAYTNAGEVLRIGATTIGTGRVIGTSFAAPRLSALEALYLLGGGSGECQGNRPPLGYAELPARPDWENLPLAAAEARYCTDFGTRTALPAG
jgi:hypothetical protein